MAPAIDIEGLDERLPGRLLAPAPVPGAGRPDAAGHAGRGLRVSWTERRRQDHHAQAAAAAGFSDGRPGRDSRPAGGDLAVRRRIGYLPENPYFYDNLTAEELLRYFASLFGYRGSERRGARRRAARRGRHGAERRMQLRKYSKGMVQRVGIAQALHQRSGGPLPRRADVGPRSAGPPRHPRADPRAARSRDDGVLQLAHPVATPKRCAAASRSSPADGWPPVGRLTDMAGYELRGWEVVVTGSRRRCGRAARPRRGITATAVSATAATRLSCRKTRGPKPSSASLPRRARRCVGDPLHTTLEEIFVRAGGDRPRPRARGRCERPRRLGRSRSPCSANRCATACSTTWSASPAGDRRVVPDRPDDRRPGRQDHQGPGPGGDVDLRRVHRHLHRHRPGLEGSRAAEHLQPIAKPVRRSELVVGKFAGLVLDHRDQPRGDGGASGTRCLA